MKLTLPLPPTDNQLRIPVQRGRSVQLVKSPAYRAWEHAAGAVWCEYTGFWDDRQCGFMYVPTYEKQLQLKYELHLADKRKDCSNFTKALHDFLKGRLWTDDKWVSLSLITPVVVVKGQEETVDIYLP